MPSDISPVVTRRQSAMSSLMSLVSSRSPASIYLVVWLNFQKREYDRGSVRSYAAVIMRRSNVAVAYPRTDLQREKEVFRS
jgi:hypothetical protein